jgi:predicted transposase YbfD/YdcC
VIGLSIIAVLGNAEGFEEIEDFGRSKLEWLKTFLELRNGIPSHDTIARVFQRIDPAAFEQCFSSWVTTLQGAHGGGIVAIDGKTLRRSFDTAAHQSALHLVSAFASEQRLILGQRAVDGKSNEITAIPELLKMLDISGATVTIDAMGCQKEIAATIREQEAHYVLALKGNHPHLSADVEEFFKNKEYATSSTCSSTEAGHGRIEQRTYTVTSDIASLCLKNEWKDLLSIGMVESTRELKGKTCVEKRYYLTSHVADAQLFAARVRGHWGIENSLHWVLDVTFREDESRLRAGNAAHNFAILRHIVYNLIKSYQPPKPKSFKRKKKLAFWSQEYILKILLAENSQLHGI